MYNILYIYILRSDLKIGLTETLEGILPQSPEHKTDYEQKLDIFEYSNCGNDVCFYNHKNKIRFKFASFCFRIIKK